MKKRHYQEAHGVIVLKRSHKRIKELWSHAEKTKIHGHKVWDSSYVLMDFLLDEPILKRSPMMELGCGWGLLSVFLAHYFEAYVTAIDADKNVFPFARTHADINDVELRLQCKRFERLTTQELGYHQLIVGSDICFWHELTPIIFNCIQRALKGGVPRILIADPGRAPFFELHERCENKFDTTLYEHSSEMPYHAEAYILDISQSTPHI